MNLLNINVPKDRASMILDPYTGAESYSTTLYLYKSNIVFWEEGNKYSAEMEIDLNKNPKKVKMIKQTLAREYGSFLITFLNADFSNAENAYNTFFVYYGLECLNHIDNIRKKYPIEYTSRYVSTKKFLDYYNKAFELVKKDYIKFQDLLGQFYSNMRFSIMKGYDKEDIKEIDNNEKIEALAYEIANDKTNNMCAYLYESTSHFALAYISLNDLIRNTKKNISICQNCGRYFLPSSGKEIYCELFNLDGSPSCRSYASRKTYEGKIIDNVAELTYKREYQRRITRVYRSDETEKTMRQKEFALWKTKARKQLSLYRQGKITQQDFCEWIEKNK